MAFSSRSGRSVWLLRRAFFFLLCLCLVKLFALDSTFLFIGKPLEEERNANLGLGANLIHVKKLSDYRLSGVEFSYPSPAKKPLEIVLRFSQVNLGILFDEEAPISAVTFGHDGTLISSGDIPAESGRCNITFAGSRVSLACNAKVVKEIDIPPGEEPEVFFRSGTREHFSLPHVPRDLVLVYRKGNAVKSVRAGNSVFTDIFSLLIWGIFLFALLDTMPRILGHSLMPELENALRVSMLAVLVAFPFLRAVMRTHSMYSSIEFSRLGDRAGVVSLGDNEEVHYGSPAGPRALIIGGSAGKGQPFTRERSIGPIIDELARRSGLSWTFINISNGGWDIRDWDPHVNKIAEHIKPDLVLVYFNANSFMFRTIRVPRIVFTALLNYPGLRGAQLIPRLFDFAREDSAHAVAEDYYSFVRRFQMRNVPVVFIDDPVSSGAPFFSDEYDAFRKKVIVKLSANKVPVIPLYDEFKPKDRRFLFHDLMHLTPGGYRQAGRLIFESLRQRGFLATSHH